MAKKQIVYVIYIIYISLPLALLPHPPNPPPLNEKKQQMFWKWKEVLQ